MVKGKPWPVAERYQLHEHIGAGSYGDVCRATDLETGEMVALKRVADVLCCPMLAKRVLREVCIMRRLSHPYVIRRECGRSHNNEVAWRDSCSEKEHE